MLRRAAVGSFAIAGLLAGAANAGGPADGVLLPSPAACTLRASRLPRAVRLELSPGVPYAEVGGAEWVELSLPVAPAPESIGLRLQTERFTLDGLAPAAAVALHAREPFLIGELFLPTPSTALRWTDAAEGAVGVELALGAATLKAVKGVAKTLRARRGCVDLGLDVPPYEPLQAVGGSGLNEKAGFATAAPVPVSPEPGTPAIARLIPGRALSASTVVIERRSGWARIAVDFDSDNLVLVGWVPATALRAPRGDDARAPVGYLGLMGEGPAEFRRPLACDRELGLAAEARGVRRAVGTLRAGVRIERASDSGEYAVVRIDGLRAAKGAKFLVRRSELDACTAAPAR